MYEVINRECVYNGIEYRIVSVLDSDLLLVVLKKNYDEGNYPLQTYIIPDEELIERRKNMR
jgi:hypothetical protein